MGWRTTAIAAACTAMLALPGTAGGQAPAVDIDLLNNHLEYGRSTVISGRAPGYTGPVSLEADGFVFGDGFQRIAETTADTDGRFRFAGVAPPRNTRYRVNAGGRLSRERTVYVDLRFGLRFRGTRERARARIDVVGPPDAALVDPTVVMYMRRGRTRTLRRLATAQLREHAEGRFRAVVSGALPASRRVYRYTTWYCTPEPRDDGFGRRVRIDEVCGQPTVPLRAFFQLLD